MCFDLGSKKKEREIYLSSINQCNAIAGEYCLVIIDCFRQLMTKKNRERKIV
jgi:hypothetical protein